MKKKSLMMLLAMMLAVTCMTGCGSSGKSDMSMEMAATAAEEPAAMAEEALPEEEYLSETAAYDAGYGEEGVENENMLTEETPEAEATDTQVQDPLANRKLITTMNLSVETENFDSLMAGVEKQVASLGGYIESSEQWNGSYDYRGNRNAYLTIRIPADKLDGFVESMEEISNITSKSRSVEDVTLSYVDLESHKKALETEEARLLELMEMAETVEDLITIEDKLAYVRYELESMESQLRTYDNKINYSTVYMDINEVTRLTPEEEPTTWGRIKTGFSENVYHVKEFLKNSLIGLVINIPYIVLWVVVLGVIGLIVFLAFRHDKKKRMKRLNKEKAEDGGTNDGSKS